MSKVTDLIDKVCLNVGKLSGIGLEVNNKQISSNVATLTTASAHGLSVGNIILVRGVGSDYNGYQTVVSVPTTTTVTFAVSASDEGSTAVSPTGMLSTRLAQGKRRFAESEHFENVVRALTAQSQGYFSCYCIQRMSPGANDVVGSCTLASLLFVKLPKDTTTDCSDLQDFLEEVAGKMILDSELCEVGSKALAVRYTDVTEQFTNEDDIAVFEYESEYTLGLAA